MKVALLTDGIYPYVMGGMQKHSFYLAKYLAKQGVEVHVFFFKKYNTGNPFTENEMKFIRLYEIPYPPQKKYIGHYLRESYVYSKNIYNKIKQNLSSFDFVYAQGFSGWELINQKKKGELCPTIAVNFHGIEMFQKSPNFIYWLKSLMLSPFIRKNIRNADISISLGGKLTELLKQNKAKKIEISPIGIENTWLINEANVKNNTPRRFLFIGRYERRKGIEELSKVLLKIVDTSDFEFVFIGPIPENKRLIHPKIVYYGMVREEKKIKEICQSSDFLVSPSYAEGMPTVILEAMSSGCAIIASDVGAVSDLVSDQNGFLIAPGNETELEAAIKNALKISDEKLIELKKSSINHVKDNYTWDKIVIRTLALMESNSEKNYKLDI